VRSDLVIEPLDLFESAID